MSKKGTILLITSFTVFVLTILGFGLLIFSQIHLKISSYYKFSLANNYAAECGVKEGFEEFLKIIRSSDFFTELKNEDISFFQEEIKKENVKILEKLFNFSLPLKGQNSWGNFKWEWMLSSSLKRSSDYNKFLKLLYDFNLKSSGWSGKETSSFSTLKGEIEIFAGNIPLFLFPVLLEKRVSLEILDNLEIIVPNKKFNFREIYLPEKELIPSEANEQIFKALNIKYFYPYKLSYLELRKAIGLELIDEPIPPGVYLIKDNMGLGGIYVEGDLEEMVLAIEGNFQVIGFFMKEKSWVLKFSPEMSETIFKTPSETQIFDLIPKGIVIVNGKIKSLTSGIINSKGIPVPCDEEIPSVLKGVNLTIISSDKIEISSHLIIQGVEWKDGIPYVKENNESSLVLFSTGKDFFNNKEKNGGIIINPNSQEELKIQASLIAKGSGIEVNGENKKVQIFGSIQATNINPGKNKLKIIYDGRFKNKEISETDYPLTISPLIFFSDLRLLYWKDFNENS